MFKWLSTGSYQYRMQCQECKCIRESSFKVCPRCGAEDSQKRIVARPVWWWWEIKK